MNLLWNLETKWVYVLPALPSNSHVVADFVHGHFLSLAEKLRDTRSLRIALHSVARRCQRRHVPRSACREMVQTALRSSRGHAIYSRRIPSESAKSPSLLHDSSAKRLRTEDRSAVEYMRRPLASQLASITPP